MCSITWLCKKRHWHNKGSAVTGTKEQEEKHRIRAHVLGGEGLGNPYTSTACREMPTEPQPPSRW